MQNTTTALIAATLCPSMEDRAAVFGNAFTSPEYRRLYQDDASRRSLRTLIEGAALAGARVTLAFFKNGGELRYMLAEPQPGADSTYRYVTVKDVALSEAAGRDVFRRVCLDTVVSLSIVYGASTGTLN